MQSAGVEGTLKECGPDKRLSAVTAVILCHGDIKRLGRIFINFIKIYIQAIGLKITKIFGVQGKICLYMENKEVLKYLFYTILDLWQLLLMPWML
jgi:hypothetical protein